MPLSRNEIKTRAAAFSKEWQDTLREEADAKPFLDAFFNVFDVSRKKIGTFEYKVKKLNDTDGYIDLLWKGVLLIEMKSRGKDLDKAFAQAKEYAQKLSEAELPKYILVCDFNTFILYDIEEQSTNQFELKDVVKHIELFGFISGWQKVVYKEQDPANVKAAELMGKLHDRLEEIGYTGHVLEIYLVRILFCLFAEDTTIFDKQQFQDYIEQRTSKDGSDLAARLQELFQVLNTPEDRRYKNLDEQLASFPYVNGKLFGEPLPMASFDSAMRQALLNCCYMDWSRISPAIFGSMFQSVMNPKERRNLGAHYTSEKNILKLIKPLFLDELWAEFEKVKANKNELRKFHDKISRLRFLDPACGCGNFLIITYRELRLLEIEILKLQLKGQTVTDIGSYILLDVDRFYGIEYEEFPAQIAQVAMWLADHQMNMEAGLAFGAYFARLPLQKSATIIHGNALRLNWQRLLIPESTTSIYAETANIIVNEPKEVYKSVNIYAKKFNEISAEMAEPDYTEKFDYILGNPPFIGKHLQNAAQKEDMELIFRGVNGAGVLDYVAAWYIKAAAYMNAGGYHFANGANGNNKITKTAFVSTNSISQGEQVSILWHELFNHYKIKIHFAHRTFKWGNDAKGNAAVHVVIIGFSNTDTTEKRIFEYDDIKAEPHEIKAKNINPYLVESKDLFLPSRRKPICNVPEMLYGNKIVDGGFYLFTDQEKAAFILSEPNAGNFFKPILSGDEFINGRNRWVLYLKEASPAELHAMPKVVQRIAEVKKYRLASTKRQTQETAATPTLFAEPRQPNSDFLLIPRTSSEFRRYIPLGFFPKEFIVNDSCTALPNAELYHFGVMSSAIHITWVKYVCGRLKSDFRYSNSLVCNNFPWPENPSAKQKVAVETAAQAVLDARAQFTDSSLADLYDPNTMPPALVKAHQQLDKAVDLCYRPQPFTTETKRIEYLFELYDKYTAGLFVKEKKKKK
jgi:type I restriction-modification system DNA methylase subunit